ncbi:MAG: helix-turn-helix domain-containing protein [Pseudoxanthomonas sp.]|nr:helix-turn-helix domain-containing protein [Pseudoxanthomonas sp.]
MNAWLLVYALGAGQGALLALALWQRRHEAAGQGLLAAWIALASLDLAVRALYLADPGPGLLRPYRLVGLFPFLHASAFYLYCRTVVRGDRLRRADLLHLAVFALAVLAWGDLLLLDEAGLAELYRALAAGRIPARAPWLDLAMMAWGLACLLLALRLVWRYRRRLLASASDGDPGALRWLIAMGLSQALIWAIAFGQWLTTLPWLSYRLIYAAVAAWVFLVGYLALVRPQVPHAAGDIDEAAAAGPPAPEPPPAAGHEDPRADAVAARIDALMTQGRVHREPALTIAQLARRSGYPEYLVSAVINRRHGVPFWEFVNRHRIADVCAALADPRDARTVLEIAFAAGFTAKSTFNAAFKRLQGETPAAYRRRCAADPAAATRRPAG